MRFPCHMHATLFQLAKFVLSRRVAIGVIVWLSYVAPILPTANGAESITVWLQSGRQFTGVVDAKTDTQQLWLRSGDTTVGIQRPIEWQRIVKAESAGKPIDQTEMQALAKLDKPLVPPQQEAIQLPFRGVFVEPVAQAEERGGSRIKLPNIRSLAADAFAANWDSDVESDGLVVQLYPLDRERNTVPVQGTLEVELFAPQVRGSNDAPYARGLSNTLIGRWSRSVSPEDFTAHGATFELPFQAVHPEFDLRVVPYGMVHVRLSVPGQGVFDTTQDLVRIRPWSPLRDSLWSHEGRRFLHTERTGRPASAANRPGR